MRASPWETSAGGLARIDKVLEQHKPAIVILGLGGNDGLRGLPLAEMTKNLAAIIERAQKAGARVLLVGVRIPPNYGIEYSEGFAAYLRGAGEAPQDRARAVPYGRHLGTSPSSSRPTASIPPKPRSR
jgi:acyl-CoA thioesterase-1